MERRHSQNDQLVEDFDFSFDPYLVKKNSVLFMLGKILYGAIVFVCFGLGVYFSYESTKDILSKDSIDFNKKSHVK